MMDDRVDHATNGFGSTGCDEVASSDRSKRFIDLALDAQLDTFFLFEPATAKALRWNRAFRERSGYSDAEIAALPAPATYYAPEDLEQAATFVQRVMIEGAGTIELDLICKDGRRIPTEHQVSVINDEQGAPRYVVSVGRDITRRKAAEAALQRSEARMSALVANLQGMSYRCSNTPDWLMDFVSAGAAELLGHDPGSAGAEAPLRYGDLIHPDDKPRVWTTVQQAVDSAVPFEIEYRIRTLAGDEKWVWERGRAVASEATPGLTLEGFISDITERKRAQEALQQSEEKFRSIVDNVGIGVALISPEMEILELNRQMRRWFPGIDAACRPICHQAFNNPPLDAVCDWCPTYKTLQDGEVHESTTNTPQGGEIHNYRIISSPVKNAKGEVTGAIEMVEEITERLRLQAQVVQSDRLASMGMLAAGMAHEINNPLSYVLYNLESLAADLPAMVEAMCRLQTRLSEHLGPAELQQVAGADLQQVGPAALGDLGERFGDALDGARRIQAIARGLGTFSRVEEDQLVPVDPNQVVETAANMALNEIKYRARLVKDLGQVPEVTASEGRLSQVFLNLLINAAHAVEEGDSEHNEIRVRTWLEGNQVCAEVRDSGRGIAPEHLEQVFDPFFTTKAVGVGSGLGLAISRNIVESYGGAISAGNVPGGGAAFTLRLPARIASTAPLAVASVPQVEPPIRGRILVVDDEARLRAAMVRMLDEHETVEAASGGAARRLLERDQGFDLIICDMMMPEISGMDLHRWLVEAHPRLARQVIFVTGGAFTPRASAYLNQVSNLRLEKPFDVRNFKKIVGELVRSSKGSGA